MFVPPLERMDRCPVCGEYFSLMETTHLKVFHPKEYESYRAENPSTRSWLGFWIAQTVALVVGVLLGAVAAVGGTGGVAAIVLLPNLIVTLIVFIPWLVSEPKEKDQASRTPDDDSIGMYFHPEGLWRIIPPVGWQPIEGEGTDSIWFEPPAPRLARFSVQWAPGLAEGYANLEAWFQKHLEALQSDESRRVSSWEQAMDGAAYEVVLAEGDNQAVYLHIFLEKDGFSVKGWTTQSRWNKDEALLRKVVYSFLPIPFQQRSQYPTSAP